MTSTMAELESALHLGDYAAVISVTTSGIAAADRQPNAALYLTRARALCLSGASAEALRDANEAVALDSGWSRAFVMRAICLVAVNRLHAAMAALERARALDHAMDEDDTVWALLHNHGLG